MKKKFCRKFKKNHKCWSCIWWGIDSCVVRELHVMKVNNNKWKKEQLGITCKVLSFYYLMPDEVKSIKNHPVKYSYVAWWYFDQLSISKSQPVITSSIIHQDFEWQLQLVLLVERHWARQIFICCMMIFWPAKNFQIPTSHNFICYSQKTLSDGYKWFFQFNEIKQDTYASSNPQQSSGSTPSRYAASRNASGDGLWLR